MRKGKRFLIERGQIPSFGGGSRTECQQAAQLCGGRPYARAERREEVQDLDGRLIGRGLANPHSRILVRMLARSDESLSNSCRWLSSPLKEESCDM
jgi:23S rRNA G2069 N7-methylase RlmK/C1962 C5-methylase RlmI